MMNGIKNICAFGASSSRIDKKYINAAYSLGSLLAGHDIVCVNGAGKKGLMRAISDGTLDNGGKAVGIIPQFMVDNNWQNDRLTEIIVTADMHSRKSLMAERSDAVVALPGGCGTLEELLEIITWKQLGLYRGIIIILNTDGFYDNLIDMLHRCVDDGFMKESHLSLWHTADTPLEVIEILGKTDIAAEAFVESKY